MPTEKFEGGAWAHPTRLPLGGGWKGQCTAPGHKGEQPEPPELEQCNLGYANSCHRMPVERPWDTVRFGVRANVHEQASAEVSVNPGEHVLVLQYACERQHRPADHGTLEFDLVSLQWLRSHGDAGVQRMAECFLESVLAKRGSERLVVPAPKAESSPHVLAVSERQ